MKVYAVTYTDPSEPWGAAVLDGKLYRTPTQLVDALNEHFDAYMAGEAHPMDQAFPGETHIQSYMRRFPRNCMDRDGRPWTELEVGVDEWRREYGCACYDLT